MQFAIAANNDNATWNFVNVTSSGPLPASLAGNRYFRYKVFLNTTDPNATPELDDATFEFAADCVPPAQALFTNLSQGSYAVDATAANYAEASGTVSVGAGETPTTISLTHL